MAAIRTILLALIPALLVVAGAPARAEWLRAESPNFVVFSRGSETTLRAQVTELEDFDGVLRALTGAAERSPNKLQVYIVRGRRQMRTVGEVGNSVAGFYDATTNGILAVIDEEASGGDGRTETLLHEYAHHFMLQYFPAAYPDWYVEGFAEYLGPTRFTESSIEIGWPNYARVSWLEDFGSWISIDRLMFDGAALRGSRFYALSWLTVHYLLRDPERSRQLRAYLVAIGRGVPPRTAFPQAFHTTPDGMQQALRDYTGRTITYSRMPRPSASSPPVITVTRMPASADRLLLDQAAMRSGLIDNPELLIRRVRRNAEGLDDPFARRVLAEAEALHGDGAAADRLLATLLERAPRDAELLYLQGMRYLAAGRRDEGRRAALFAQAQPWFVRAHRADGNHYQTLFRYAESLSAGPDFISENTSNILLLAHQTAPQVDAISYAAAIVLMRRGEYADAEALLTRLAAGHHGEQFAETLRGLLAKARAHDNRDLPDAFRIPTGASG